MKRSLPSFLLAIGVTVLGSCGKKGPLQPPLIRIPQPVADFVLTQRGERFILSWKNPTAYIDGHPLGEVAEIEVWLMVREPGQGMSERVSLDEFEERATLVERIPREKFPFLRAGGEVLEGLSFVFSPEKEEGDGRIYTFGLKAKDVSRRSSAFSELLSIKKEVLPSPPQEVRAQVFEDHVELTWEAPLHNTDLSAPPRIAGYHVYRAEEKKPSRRLTASPIQLMAYQDNDISFDKTYLYSIRAVASVGGSFLESDDSEPVEVRVSDAFPPTPPLGLTAVAGAGYVALSWQANSETDLAGYKVWRREAGQKAFRLLASVSLEENTFLDRTVEKNKGYDYAITALDRSGNESARSEAVSIVAREEIP